MVRVAAIDCGTNSIRLLVAELESGRLTDVVRRMEIVRLGQGVDATGRLAPDAIERTRVALSGYASEIRRLGAERLRLVATSASRDAENADEFRAMVHDTMSCCCATVHDTVSCFCATVHDTMSCLGEVTPEVVTGDEEARLSFDGAVRGLPAEAEPPYLVVDIGGGSTEFVRGSSVVDSAFSVDIGCVRITERHLRSDPPTAVEIAAAEGDIGVAVDRALEAVSGRLARTLVGLAGSVTTVTGIALGLSGYDPERIHHARLSYVDVVKVAAGLLAAPRTDRLAIPVMHPGRADVIGAGALILRVIMERLGADSIVASEHDILDGIAWSLV